MDKQRILELYLNVAEWGVGVFGIEAAAQHYYKRPAARLTARQAAWLASILPSPKRYDLNRQSRWVERKNRHSFASNATSSGSTELNQTKPNQIQTEPKPTLAWFLKDQSSACLRSKSQTASKPINLLNDSKL